MPQRKKTDWDRLKAALPEVYALLKGDGQQESGSADPSPAGVSHNEKSTTHPPELVSLADKRVEMVVNGMQRYNLSNNLFLNRDPLSGRSWLAFPFDAAIALLDAAFAGLPRSSSNDLECITMIHEGIRKAVYREACGFEEGPLLDFFVYLALCRYEQKGIGGGLGQIAKRYNLGLGFRQYYGWFGGYAEGAKKPSQRRYCGSVLALELSCVMFDRHWKDAQDLNLTPLWDRRVFLEFYDLAVNLEKGYPDSLTSALEQKNYEEFDTIEGMMSYRSAISTKRSLESRGHRNPPLKYREPLAVALSFLDAPPSRSTFTPQNALDVVREECSKGWQVSPMFLDDLSQDIVRLYTFAACILTGRFDITRTDGYLVKLFGAKGAPRTGDYRPKSPATTDDKSKRCVRAFLYGRNGSPYKLAFAKCPAEILRVESPGGKSPIITGALQEPTGDDMLWVSPDSAAFRAADGTASRCALGPDGGEVHVGPYDVIPLIINRNEADTFSAWRSMTDDLRVGSPVPLEIKDCLPSDDDFSVTFACHHPLASHSAAIAESARQRHVYVESGTCARGGFTLAREKGGPVTIRRAGSSGDGDVLVRRGGDWFLLDGSDLQIPDLIEFSVAIFRRENPTRGLHTFHFRLPGLALSVAEHRLFRIEAASAKARDAAKDEARILQEVRDSLYGNRGSLVNWCDWYPSS